MTWLLAAWRFLKSTPGLILGALAAILVYGGMKHHEGRRAAQRAAEERDRRTAREVETQLADARRDGDAVDRLRKQGRLRD